MSQAVELVLLRHGETEWNKLRRIQGQLDVELNATGLRQARLSAAQLESMRFDALYCSDLRRTRQTAEPIAHHHGLTPRYDQRLRERHYGGFQGQYYDDIQRADPARFARLMSREPDYDLEGGETLHEFDARSRAVIAEIIAAQPGRRVAIVTHGGVLDCFYRMATGMALGAARDFALPNAAINIVRYSSRGQVSPQARPDPGFADFEIVVWARIEHLGASGDEASG